VTWPLVAGLGGLAALDSLNPATLVAVTLILLGSRTNPVADTLGFVAGAFLTVLGVGAVVYVGADAATNGVANGLVWVRRAAFGLAAAAVLVSAIHALRPRRRRELVLPAWFTPGTAAGLGVLMTGADLPNAFPYFIAIERLVSADVGAPVALALLAAYAVIYCLPCLVLLAIGLRGGPVTRHLRRLHDRFGTAADIPASKARAAGLAALAAGLAAIAGTA
jgi:cytochrome c biogenesis protein CcdA